MNTISVEILRTWLEEGRPVMILDVRPTDQRTEWVIPGSVHIDAYRALQEQTAVPQITSFSIRTMESK